MPLSAGWRPSASAVPFPTVRGHLAPGRRARASWQETKPRHAARAESASRPSAWHGKGLSVCPALHPGGWVTGNHVLRRASPRTRSPCILGCFLRDKKLLSCLSPRVFDLFVTAVYLTLRRGLAVKRWRLRRGWGRWSEVLGPGQAACRRDWPRLCSQSPVFWLLLLVHPRIFPMDF